MPRVSATSRASHLSSCQQSRELSLASLKLPYMTAPRRTLPTLITPHSRWSGHEARPPPGGASRSSSGAQLVTVRVKAHAVARKKHVHALAWSDVVAALVAELEGCDNCDGRVRAVCMPSGWPTYVRLRAPGSRRLRLCPSAARTLTVWAELVVRALYVAKSTTSHLVVRGADRRTERGLECVGGWAHGLGLPS